MGKCYFEFRKQAARGTDSIAADIMRHLNTRQHLGTALVICDQPAALMSTSRKQWLKLARVIQKQRSSTLNADKILKYTHTITHMQHMRFTFKSPLDDPSADVFFASPAELSTLPLHCFSIYVHASLNADDIADILMQLPIEALLIDYAHETDWAVFGLQPKRTLEEQVTTEWRHMRQFLQSRDIDITGLAPDHLHNIEAMDDALDALLAVSSQFLRLANEFQHALELARPVRINKEVREHYDVLILLAHRVQALSPGAFSQRFLESYNEDDTFFLYDVAKGRFIMTGETLAQAVARHLHAGRVNLAEALRVAMR